MQLDPLDFVFLAGLLGYIGIRHVFIERTKGTEKTLCRMDGVERGLLALVGVGTLLLPLLHLFTPLLRFADFESPEPVRWCGVCVMGAALWLFWRSHSDLGLNWSVTLELRKGHEIIRHGVYRLVRHPMYASIWLWGLAQGLLLDNWLAGWGAFVGFAPLYFVRTPREEKMMCEQFPGAYAEYMQSTGRVWPRLGGPRR